MPDQQQEKKPIPHESLGMINPKAELKNRKKIDLSSIPTHDPETGKKLTAMERLAFARIDVKVPTVKVDSLTQIEGRRPSSSKPKSRKSKAKPKKSVDDLNNSDSSLQFELPIKKPLGPPKIQVIRPDAAETEFWKSISNNNTNGYVFGKPEDFLAEGEIVSPHRMRKEKIKKDLNSSKDFALSGEVAYSRPEDWLKPMDGNTKSETPAVET